ncbi:MAG: hypothetical protein OXC07_11925, partial [Kistimonas sp.]|nr:hypothetical protein [Kistimonas sp.]
ILNTGVFDPNRLSRQSDMAASPLFYAMDYSQDCVADLLKAGADPNLGNVWGMTPLEKCIRPLTKDKVGKLNALLDLAPRAGQKVGTSSFSRDLGIDVNFVFYVRSNGRRLFNGSPLAAAAFWFLYDAHYPVEVVEKLASKGACLLMEDPTGLRVDWTASHAQWVQEGLRKYVNIVFPEEKVEQLQEAIKRGRALGAKAGKGKGRALRSENKEDYAVRSSAVWSSVVNTMEHGLPSWSGGWSPSAAQAVRLSGASTQ